MAPEKINQNRWVRVLNYLIKQSKKEDKAENLDWTQSEAYNN